MSEKGTPNRTLPKVDLESHTVLSDRIKAEELLASDGVFLHEDMVFPWWPCQEKVEALPDFSMLVSGRRRSGKNVLNDDMRSRGAKLYAASQTHAGTAFNGQYKKSRPGRTISEWDPDRLLRALDVQKDLVGSMRSEMIAWRPEKKVSREEYVRLYKKQKEEVLTPFLETHRICIDIDDAIANSNLFYSQAFIELWVAGRHYNMSVFCTTQYLNKIPPVARANADYVAIFEDDNESSLEALYRSYGAFATENDRHVWNVLMARHTGAGDGTVIGPDGKVIPRDENNHLCIIIDRTARTIKDRYFVYQGGWPGDEEYDALGFEYILGSKDVWEGQTEEVGWFANLTEEEQNALYPDNYWAEQGWIEEKEEDREQVLDDNLQKAANEVEDPDDEFGKGLSSMQKALKWFDISTEV